MKATSADRLPSSCKIERILRQLLRGSEGWERSQLVIQLIEELNAGMLLSCERMYPPQAAIWSEKSVRYEEQITRSDLAKAALYSVLIDTHMAFPSRVATLQFLVEELTCRMSRQKVSQEEAGVRSGDLDLLGQRVAALHQKSLPVAVDSDRTSVRRAPVDLPGMAGAPAASGASRTDVQIRVKRAA